MAWSVTLVRLTSAKVIAACWINDDVVTITMGAFTAQAGCLSREKTLLNNELPLRWKSVTRA
jgi:hypothetical protein